MVSLQNLGSESKSRIRALLPILPHLAVIVRDHGAPQISGLRALLDACDLEYPDYLAELKQWGELLAVLTERADAATIGRVYQQFADWGVPARDTLAAIDIVAVQSYTLTSASSVRPVEPRPVPRHIQVASNPLRKVRNAPEKPAPARVGNPEWRPFLIVVITIVVAFWFSQSFRSSMPAFPALPADLVLRGLTGQRISDTVAHVGGGELVLSNSPEQLDANSLRNGPLCLCQVTSHQAAFRVFLHHQNDTDETISIGLMLKNETERTTQVFLGRNSRKLSSTATAADAMNTASGWGAQALQQWFESRPEDENASAEPRQPFCTLRPGEHCILLESIEDRGGLITGIYDFKVRDADDPKIVPHLLITTFAEKGTRRLRRDPSHLPWAAPDSVAARARDLFEYNGRDLDFNCSMDGVYWLDLGGEVEGPYSFAIPGEYAAALTSNEHVNLGNYGVMYALKANLFNPFAQAMRVKVLLNAAGGSATSVVTVDGHIKASPHPVLQDHESWVLQEIVLQPGEHKTVAIRYSLPGGSPGAQRLYFWPERLQE